MTDNVHDADEKRVDEGWKKKAREEREALEEQEAASKAAEGATVGEDAGEGAPAGEKGPRGGTRGGELPQPTFAGFISGLATQAFVYMGLVENPLTGKKEKDLEAAQHVLDTMAMLQEKTSGNLTAEESAYLEDLLYNLRMGYVEAAR